MAEQKLFIFADGPNYYISTQNNFKLSFEKLKNLLSRRYGQIAGFNWYDLEPPLPLIDAEKLGIDELEKINQKAIREKRKLEDLVLEYIKTRNGNSEKIIEQLGKHYRHTYYANKNYINKIKFLEMIRINGAEVILEPFRTYSETGICTNCKTEVPIEIKREAGITDFNLANDLQHYASMNKYDTAVVISGDGHLAKPIEQVRERGKRVVVSFFERNTNNILKEKASEYLSFESIRSDIEWY